MESAAAFLRRHPVSNALATLGFGLLGAGFFASLHLPAPWLSGAMIGLVLMLGLRLPPLMPDALRDLGMLLAGVMMGSAITPQMLAALERYPASLTILTATTIAIVAAGRFALMRLYRWGGDEALFAALPGAMSAVLATAAAAKVDMLRVTLVQSFRMFVLVALLPSLVSLNMAQLAPPVAPLVSPLGFGLVLALGLCFALLLVRLRMLAPYLLGGMLGAGLTHATGLISGAPPAAIANLAIFLIWVFAGSRFHGLTLAALRGLFFPALTVFFITSLVALAGAELTHAWVGTPWAEALVAFAPGGLEAMVVLGIALGLDPLYVSSHHIARFILIALLLPLCARFILRGDAGKTPLS